MFTALFYGKGLLSKSGGGKRVLEELYYGDTEAECGGNYGIQ